MSQQLLRRWFTVGEYNRMAETGILTANDRVELIEGEIVEMSPVGSRHAACVNRLNMLLSNQAGQSFIVSVQNPIVANDYSEPEPDVAVLRPRADYYAEELPSAADVLLVVEVADTTVETDRSVKMALYARSNIPEAILVNLPRGVIEAYADPVNSQYESVRILGRGDTFRSRAVSNLTVEVDAILT